MHNILLLLRRMIKILRNALIDISQGQFIGTTIKTRYSEAGAHSVASTDYAVFPYIFKDLIRPEDVLVDVGCRKGRVILWWLKQGYKNEIIGIDIDKQVVQETGERFQKFNNV